jgi:hypothetical protein
MEQDRGIAYSNLMYTITPLEQRDSRERIYEGRLLFVLYYSSIEFRSVGVQR